MRSIWHDEPKAREAFRQGARDAFESSVIHMDAREKRAISQWLDELDEWHGGEPPLPRSTGEVNRWPFVHRALAGRDLNFRRTSMSSDAAI